MRLTYRRSADDDKTVEIDITPLGGRETVYRVTVGDRVFDLSASLFHHAAFIKQAGEVVVQVDGKEYHLFDATQQRQRPATGRGDLRAPMAGKVIRVLVQPGDCVQAGDTLVILEAMKMEQPIMAPQDGVVDQVHCHEGDQVTAGMELVVLTSRTDSAEGG